MRRVGLSSRHYITPDIRVGFAVPAEYGNIVSENIFIIEQWQGAWGSSLISDIVLDFFGNSDDAALSMLRADSLLAIAGHAIAIAPDDVVVMDFSSRLREIAHAYEGVETVTFSIDI